MISDLDKHAAIILVALQKQNLADKEWDVITQMVRSSNELHMRGAELWYANAGERDYYYPQAYYQYMHGKLSKELYLRRFVFTEYVPNPFSTRKYAQGLKMIAVERWLILLLSRPASEELLPAEKRLVRTTFNVFSSLVFSSPGNAKEFVEHIMDKCSKALLTSFSSSLHKEVLQSLVEFALKSIAVAEYELRRIMQACADLLDYEHIPLFNRHSYSESIVDWLAWVDQYLSQNKPFLYSGGISTRILECCAMRRLRDFSKYPCGFVLDDYKPDTRFVGNSRMQQCFPSSTSGWKLFLGDLDQENADGKAITSALNLVYADNDEWHKVTLEHLDDSFHAQKILFRRFRSGIIGSDPFKTNDTRADMHIDGMPDITAELKKAFQPTKKSI